MNLSVFGVKWPVTTSMIFLAAILLGPWAGMLVLTSVLAVQALLFQDGGSGQVALVEGDQPLPNILGHALIAHVCRYLAVDAYRPRETGAVRLPDDDGTLHDGNRQEDESGGAVEANG